jgi:hypothetical protein
VAEQRTERSQDMETVEEDGAREEEEHDDEDGDTA